MSWMAPLLPVGVVEAPELGKAGTMVPASDSIGVAGREGGSGMTSPELGNANGVVSASGSVGAVEAPELGKAGTRVPASDSVCAVVLECDSDVSVVVRGGACCLPSDWAMASVDMAIDWGHCTRVILKGEMCMYAGGGSVDPAAAAAGVVSDGLCGPRTAALYPAMASARALLAAEWWFVVCDSAVWCGVRPRVLCVRWCLWGGVQQVVRDWGDLSL
jgi:hypothetical protein